MPGDGIDIPLDLDTSGYVQGIQSALGPTTALAQAVGQVNQQAHASRGLFDLITPGRAVIAGMTAFSAAAAVQQKELSGLHATQAVTGQSAEQLAAATRRLAREMPGGQRQAIALVQTYQQLGLTQKNQVGQIQALSKASIQLGAATGESATQLAAQTYQLDRQFNVVAPTRVKAMNDSLVSVQKNVGGTASGILSFADSIAPFAKQAGLGETAVLGISGAFSKLGADGYGATTAISKVISDLNRSVRDGSGEMQGYANAVGMTREEFTKLYKSDPAGALSRVVSSLGKPGAESQRRLEELGFEGVRTQRYLAEVAQSGNIGGAIAEARKGYGSGATENAAHAAFNNLQDDLQKLASTTGQTTEAIGTPFLGALQNITHLATKFAGVTAGIMGSRPVQDILHFGSYAALGVGGLALAARAGGRGLLRGGTLAMGYSMLTRGPVRGAAAGFGTGRGEAMAMAGMPTGPIGIGTRGLGAQMTYAAENAYAVEQEMIGLGYSPAQARAARPVMGGHLTGPVTERTFGAFGQLGRAYQQDRLAHMDPAAREGYAQVRQGLATAPPTMGIARRAFRGVVTPLSLGYEGLMRTMVTTPSVEAISKQVGPSNVTQATGLFGDLAEQRKKIWGEYTKSDMGPQAFKKMTSDWREAVGHTRSEMAKLGGSFAALERSTKATTTAVGSVGRFGAQAVGGPLVRGTGALLGQLGPTLAISGAVAAGTALVGYAHGNMARSREEEQATKSEGVFGTLDKYNDSLGLASQSTKTLSDSMSDASKALEDSVKTIGDAVKVTNADVVAAKQTHDKIVYTFGQGLTAAQLTQQAALIGGTAGLSAQQVGGVKLDMLRQGYTPGVVGQALAPLSTGGANTRPANISDVLGTITTTLGSQPSGGATSGINNQRGAGMGTHKNLNQIIAGVAAFGGGGQVGSSWNPAKPTSEDKSNIDAVAEYIQQTYDSNAEMYGETYAAQQRLIQMQDAVNTAVAAGASDDYIVTMTRKFGTMLQIKGAGSTSIGRSDIKKRGGFVQSVTHHHGNAGPTQAAATAAVGGTATPANRQKQLGALGTAFQSSSFGNLLTGPVGSLYDNRRAPTAYSQAVAASTAQPQNQALMQQSVEASIAAGRKVGQSYEKTAEQAAKMAATIDQDTDPAFQRLIATMQQAAQHAQAQAQQSPQGAAGGQLRVRLQGDRAMMNTFRNSTSDAGRQAYMGAQQDVQQAQQDFYSMLQQRLQQQRQYQVQVSRSTFDFHTSQTRAEDDFNLQMKRSQDDFQLQTQRSQEDYLISRNRQYRDYNIQLEREAEDSAKNMLSPYQRLATQQIWSTQDLLQNATRQNQQMQQQLANITKARHMGLSQQVIDMLGLADPNNAQQLASMINDMISDPKLVGQLNSMSKTKQSVSSALFGQGVDYRRQMEDFTRNLADQKSDFDKQMTRVTADFERQMSRANSDFQRQMNRNNSDFQLSLQRAAEDLKMSDEQISGSMQQLLKMTEKALNGQTVVWGNTITNGVQAQIDAVKGSVSNFNDWLIGMGWTPPAGPAGNNQTSAAGVYNTGGDLSKHGSGQRMTQNQLESLAKTAGFSTSNAHTMSAIAMAESGGFAGDLNNNPKTGDLSYGLWQINMIGSMGPGRRREFGISNNDQLYDPATNAKAAYDVYRDQGFNAWSTYKSGAYKAYLGEGAIVSKLTGLADLGVGERGAEVVLPLNQRGVSVLASAFGQAMGFDDYRAMTANAAATHIHYHHEQITEDHSVTFTGDIKVDAVANLDEFAAEAEQRVARDNFTSARGRS